MTLPTRDRIEILKKWDVPTVANAIESFKIRSDAEGFCDTDIRCLYPDLGRMIGFAATAKTSGLSPDSEGKIEPRKHWDEVVKIPEPRVAVVQDLDPPPRQGATFGECNGNLHKALGCVGLVTDGSVRDLDEVHALGFHYFARAVCVTHTYCHYVATGVPVEIGGLEVHPGDLIYGDKHGVLKIPLEIVPDLPKACEDLVRRERKLIHFLQNGPVTPESVEGIHREIAAGNY